jgi:hypothetical protein
MHVPMSGIDADGPFARQQVFVRRSQGFTPSHVGATYGGASLSASNTADESVLPASTTPDPLPDAPLEPPDEPVKGIDVGPGGAVPPPSVITVLKTTDPSPPASELGPTLSELPQPADTPNAVAASVAKRARAARDAREEKDMEEASTSEAVR